MAKDPAFLFYPGDWQGGTLTMTPFLKGCYMDLLVAQFNNGPMDEKTIKIVLGKHYKKAWPELQNKFRKNNEKKYFNMRLMEEQEKRKANSRKQKERIDNYWAQKKNLLSGNNSESAPVQSTEYTTVYSLENENRNENENVASTGKGGLGGKKDLTFPYSSAAFILAWDSWKTYLQERRNPYQTFSSEQVALQDLGKYPEQKAIEMIRHAIKNQWKNIHELQDKNKQPENPSQASTFSFDKKYNPHD